MSNTHLLMSRSCEIIALPLFYWFRVFFLLFPLANHFLPTSFLPSTFLNKLNNPVPSSSFAHISTFFSNTKYTNRRWAKWHKPYKTERDQAKRLRVILFFHMQRECISIISLKFDVNKGLFDIFFFFQKKSHSTFYPNF